MATAGSATIEGDLWSERALDWAEVQEPQARPLYDVVLERTGIGPGTTLLDIGCGAGLFLSLAAATGAEVTGIDAAPGLLAIARERVPQATLGPGEMEELPYGARTFDIVTGINAFQFAADPANALSEAARVAREGAPVVIAVWGEPHECDAAAYLSALGALMPPPPPGAPGPFALSERAALEGLASRAGLTMTLVEDVVCAWEYPDLETAVRGLLSSGPAALAIRNSSLAEATQAAIDAIQPFVDGRGRYRLENTFRYAVATAAD